jgi:hypothetical protein
MPQHHAGAALITMAMPAITANAANRLPLTPQRGRKNFRYRPKLLILKRLPIVKRAAMLSPPAIFVRFE